MFEDELPAGADCVFSGAATPSNGPAKCRDPATIFYRENASCQITSTELSLPLNHLVIDLFFPAASIEFDSSVYVVSEGAGYQQICLNTSGYDFHAKFSATYHDNDNFTEGSQL